MENELTMNATEPQGNFVVKSFDDQGQHGSHSDILNRRLKNRERQRRYRARKRLQADIKKASITDRSTAAQVLAEPEGNDNSCVTRVPSRRNWKQDARRAHVCNSVDETLETVGSAVSSFKLQTLRPSLEMATNPIGDMKSSSENSLSLPSYETHKQKLGGRNWKAEARNMKS